MSHLSVVFLATNASLRSVQSWQFSNHRNVCTAQAHNNKTWNKSSVCILYCKVLLTSRSVFCMIPWVLSVRAFPAISCLSGSSSTWNFALSSWLKAVSVVNHHHYKIDHLSPRQISGGHDIIDLPSPCRTQHSGRKFKRFLIFQQSRISKRFLPTVHDPSQPRRFSVKKKFEAGARQRRGVEMLIEIPDDRRSIIIIMQLRRVLYHPLIKPFISSPVSRCQDYFPKEMPQLNSFNWEAIIGFDIRKRLGIVEGL